MPQFSLAVDVRRCVRVAGVLWCGIWLASCSVSTRISNSQRSGVEQLLLARSLERACAQLDTSRLEGKTAALEVFGLTSDRQFAENFLGAGIQARGLKLAAGSEKPDLRIKVFLTTFGVDTGETLIGLPSFSAPIVNIPVPEIALFKSERNRGHTEMQVYAFDEATQNLVENTQLVEGRSKRDDYRVLLLIAFSVNDLDQEEVESTAPILDSTRTAHARSFQRE